MKLPVYCLIEAVYNILVQCGYRFGRAFSFLGNGLKKKKRLKSCGDVNECVVPKQTIVDFVI